MLYAVNFSIRIYQITTNKLLPKERPWRVLHLWRVPRANTINFPKKGKGSGLLPFALPIPSRIIFYDDYESSVSEPGF
jgi:hypothetical protein